MGTSRSASEFSTKITRLATTLPQANVAAVGESALAFKRGYEANLGKFRTLSKMGRKGVRITARYDVRGKFGNPTALIRAVPIGPAVIAEQGARPHLIGGGRTQGRRTQRRRNQDFYRGRYLRFPDGSVRRGPVMHPGMSGAHPWRRTRKQMETVTPQVFRRAVRRSLAQVFGG